MRLVVLHEVPRFNALLDEHHFLGRVLRYVSTEGEDWVVLLGFGSAALSLSVSSRDTYLGWSEQVRAEAEISSVFTAHLSRLGPCS